jgi:RNA polymerase sigma factor (sigma-70 family)
MPQVLDPQALLTDHLEWVDRAASTLARRHSLGADQAEEFASWVRLKLVEDDYQVLRRFRGESAVTTYLTVVIAMLWRDYRAAHWGRWRPSAAARRLGGVAVRLETLVLRDGYRLDQAGELLRTTGETSLGDRELGSLLAQLPPRAPLRPVEVGADPLEAAPSAERADERVVADEEELERAAAVRALHGALARLPPEERTMVKLRIWDELSIADVARAMGTAQKPLYRRFERVFARLREEVAAAGVTREQVLRLLGGAE